MAPHAEPLQMLHVGAPDIDSSLQPASQSSRLMFTALPSGKKS